MSVKLPRRDSKPINEPVNRGILRQFYWGPFDVTRMPASPPPLPERAPPNRERGR